MEKVAVVIPSFNSKKWISKIINQVLDKVRNSIVIVVEDNSPDGTAAEVKRKFSANKRVRLVVRTGKGGRGSAVLVGFKEALKDKSVKILVEMDSDFAHNPIDVPRLVAMNRNFDVVTASRYLPGGKVVNMPWKRYFFSRISMIWSRIVLGIPISDQTGFRSYSRKAIETMEFDKIKSKGFFAITEMAFQLHKKGFKFGEVPVTVTYSAPEESNFKFSEIKEAFLSVLQVKMSN